MHRAVGTLKAGIGYFLCLFAIAFMLGAIREIFVVPRICPSIARMIELPLMLAVTWLAAFWALARFGVTDFRDRLTVGLIAFGLTLFGEFLVGLYGLGMSPRQWLAGFASGEGVLTLVAQSAIVVFPLLQRRSGSP